MTPERHVSMQTAPESLPPQRLFIDGAWQDAEGDARIDVISPRDGQIISTLADASAADVDRSVAAARRAFRAGVWAGRAPAERKKVLLRLADLIEVDKAALGVLIARDIGMDIGTVMRVELSACIDAIRYYAEAADKVMGEVAPTADGMLGLVHRQPVGVVAAIVPWNSPMMVSAWKIAPALAAGNSVILKPAETASLALLRLGDYARAAGLPDGVLNILTGRGAVCGAALGLHMDVDVLAFTGSGPVGRRLLEYSARSNLKHVYLELGGKSPNIVFADADLKKAAQFAAISIFANCGQICAANSRLLVEASIKDAFLAEVMQAAQGFVPGDPLDPATRMGAVNSAAQLGRDLAHVEGALAEGAVLRMGGARTRAETGGYYMQPTILEVTPEMAIAREEVFGPVLSVLDFTTDEEAIAIANSTVYGLSSSIWTTNLKRAHRMVREIEAGVVNVNTWGGGDLSLPFGGVKESGNGYDRSLHAINKYTHLKSAWFDLT